MSTPIVPLPRIPSLTRRIVIASLRVIPVLIFLVGVPVAALNFLSAHGVSTPVSLLHVTLAGSALAVLGAARYVSRPTRAFGPVSMAASGVALLYLWTLLPDASATFHVGNGGSATFGYAGVLLLLMIVPALTLAAAAVTTLEDRWRPGERVRLDYPA